MASCSVTAAGELLLVGTSNGVEPSGKFPAPEAPSFLALDKQTGKLVWADNTPGANVLDGQWSSPAAAVLGGVPQAIFAGGDGWLYGFEAVRTEDRKPRRLWRFDCNPKDSEWGGGGQGRRNTIIATPMIHDGRVYVATGQDPEAGEGEGDLWCIDPGRRGDVSRDLVVDKDGKPVPPRRTIAIDKGAGDRVIPNPGSAAVWNYRGKEGEGERDFKSVMHRSLSTPAIRDGLLVTADFSGLVHCLDVKTGRPHWTHDLLSSVWGSPLVAGGRVYLGTEDGDVVVFEHAPKPKVLAKNGMGNAVYGTPAAAGGVLYVNTRSHLFAIAQDPKRGPR
jgi:outer membrane protein assembly factor BamB